MTTLPKVSDRLGNRNDVGRRVVRRQLGAALHADEARLGMRRLEAGAAPARRRRRPGARRAARARAASKARKAELDVLLGSDAADRQEDRRLVAAPQRGAAPRCAASARSARCRRRGRRCVRLWKPAARELAPRRARRHEGAPRQVVKAAQQAERRRRRESRSRSSGCTGGSWCGSRTSSAMPSAPRRGQRRPGERPGRREVHELGPRLLEATHQRGDARQAEAQLADTSESRSRPCAARRRRRAPPRRAGAAGSARRCGRARAGSGPCARPSARRRSAPAARFRVT